MLGKIVAIVSLVALPVSATLWLMSHRDPQHRRYDVTEYKSLRVFLRDGLCGLDLLSMPTKSNFKGEFQAPLNASTMMARTSLSFGTKKIGPNRMTHLVFPLWVTTVALMIGGTVPLLHVPLRQWRRRRNGWCLECGYNLRGNRSGRCPECGMKYIRVRARSGGTRTGGTRTAAARTGAGRQQSRR